MNTIELWSKMIFQCFFAYLINRNFLIFQLLIVVFYFLSPIYRITKCENQSREYLQFLIIIQNYTMKHEATDPSFSTKSKFKAFGHLTQTKMSSQLLDHIKDQQFYSSLTTIALQLAKQSGAQPKVLDQLSQCFRKVKGISSEGMLKQKSQNLDDHQKQNFVDSESYNMFQKAIPLKQQISFLQNMQHKLLSSRQKQSYSQALKKFAQQKYKESLPILNYEPETKAKRFANMIKRKNKSNLNTADTIFKKGAFDILNNTFEESNQCYKVMRNFSHLKTMFGHANDEDRQNASPIFNVLFDQTQKFIISGAQEGNVKIWSRETGLLLSSLRGHTTYINKLQISKCNKYLFSSAGDGVRFFDLKQMTSLGGWQTESIIDIVSFIDQDNMSRFIFCDKKNLYLLDQQTLLRNKDKRMKSNDFDVFHFGDKLQKESFVWNIQISSDHSKILLGFQTGEIIICHYEDLLKELPSINQKTLGHLFQLPIRHILTHHKDQIRQLKWHSNNQNFVSGGKQGYCVLWQYKTQRAPTLLRQIQVSRNFNRRKKRAFGCNYIVWNCTYTHFIAGFMELMDDDDQDRGNGEIIVYSVQEKQVVCQFSRDKAMRVASVRGLDAHPYYPNIVVICEGTGRILLFDFILKTVVNLFQLRGFHLLYPQYSLTPADCRFTKDGLAFAVSTQSGTVSLFGYDIKSFYGLCPTEQFYQTDFTPFTLEAESMRAIPVQADIPVDINRIQRGQVCNIRGQPHQNQLKSNSQNFWRSTPSSAEKPNASLVQHKNKMAFELQHQQISYKKYLKCIQINLKQDEKFYQFYHKNIEELEQTKQSILYDERLHKSNHFKKLIDDKYCKLRGLPSTQNSNHQRMFTEVQRNSQQPINGSRRGRRGRRLMKQSDRMQQQRRQPNYRQEFQWDSQKQEDYVANQEIEEQDHEDIDYDGSDSIPINTRRRMQQSYGRNRYNIRERQSRSYNQYDEQQSSQEKRQTRANFKRRSPSELVAELGNDQYQNYERKPKKKVKRNEFIYDHGDSEEVNSQSASQQRRRLRRQTRRGDSDHLGHANERYQTRNQEKNSNQKIAKKPKYGQCDRCDQQEATVTCSFCKQCSFCDKCKFKRGRQSNSQYKCFICIFLYNAGSALLEQKKISEQYFRLQERKLNVYVPQIDDQVRFFFQGYQQFLYQNIKILSRQVVKQSDQYRLVPHLYNQQLLTTPLCKVTDINYYFPIKQQNDGPQFSRSRNRNIETHSDRKHIHMLLKLEMTEQDKIQKLTEQQTNYFWVFYIPAPIGQLIPFIIRQDVFKYIETQNVIQNIKVNDVFQFNRQQYQVVEVGPYQLSHPQSIWKYLSLSKCQGKRLRGASKQQEKRYNIWDIAKFVPEIDYKPNFNSKYKSKILQAIKGCEYNAEWLEYFQNFVDFLAYPSYRTTIQVGMCISMIRTRIRNDYYQSERSFQFQVELIVKNSIAFNGESQITTIAKQIRRKLLRAIGKDSKELYNTKNNEEKQTTSKKQTKQVRQARQTRSRKRQYESSQNYEEEPPVVARPQRNRDKTVDSSIAKNLQGGHNLRPTRSRKLQMDSDFQYGNDHEILQQEKSSQDDIQIPTRKVPQRQRRLNQSLNVNGQSRRRSNRFANQRSYESSQKMLSEDNNNNTSRPLRATRSRAK